MHSCFAVIYIAVVSQVQIQIQTILLPCLKCTGVWPTPLAVFPIKYALRFCCDLYGCGKSNSNSKPFIAMFEYI